MQRKILMRRMLSLCLVFVMVWGMLPDASALEPICGLLEHEHDETCYAVYGDDVLKCNAGVYLHQHDATCYDASHNLTCYKADFYLHKHDASQGCYDANNNLVCELSEYDESIHELDYASSDNVTCVYAPRFNHVHSDACYETSRVLICEQDLSTKIHEHDESCYIRELTCDISESDPEETPEVIPEEIPEVTPGVPEETPEENPEYAPEVTPEQPGDSEPEDISELSGDELALAHVHDDSCYDNILSCNLDEYHEHDDSCYDISRNLTCEYDQQDSSGLNSDGLTICHHYQYELHTHDSSCYDKNLNVICGKWEVKSHVHNGTCFERAILSYDSDVLTCNQDEHVHGISCYFKDKTEELDAFLTAYDAFMADVNSGVYDLDSDDGLEQVALAAYNVRELSTKLDRDVLKLDSIQSMLGMLNQYIPEGFAGLASDDSKWPDCFETPIGYGMIPIEIQVPYGLDINRVRVSFDVSLVRLAYDDDDGNEQMSPSDWRAKYNARLHDGDFFEDVYDANSVKYLRIPVFHKGDYEFRIRMTYADSSNMGCLADTRDMFVYAKFNSHSVNDEFSWWNAYYYDDNIRQEFTSDGSVDENYIWRGNYSKFEHGLARQDGTIGESKFIPFMVRPDSSAIQDKTGFSPSSLNLARKYMASLTDDEKIGQLLLMHFSANENLSNLDYAGLISNYHVGGLILFDVDTQNRNLSALTDIIKSAQDKSNVPLIISVDEEGGRRSDNSLINRVSNHSQYNHAPFVSPQELYNAGGYDKVYSDAVDKAGFLKQFGFNVNHAPVSDLAKDGYVSGRSFGSDAIGTSQYVWNVVSGHESNQVGSTMKHFPGYGNTSSNTHNGFAVNDLPEELFLYRELIPFYSGMLAGGKAIMVTHNAINYLDSENCASCSPAIYSLARDMGFSGVCMTDDLNMKAITNKYGSGAVQALKAGADIALTGNGKDAAALFEAVKSGELSMREVESKCLRILAWKAELGLLDSSDLPDTPGDDLYDVEYISPDNQIENMSFDAAIKAANENGGVIKLLSDLSVNGNIRISDKQITLDLNGHELEFLSGPGFVISNSLDNYFEITDSSYNASRVLTRNSGVPAPNITSDMSYSNAYSSLTQFDDAANTATWYSVCFGDSSFGDISGDVGETGEEEAGGEIEEEVGSEVNSGEVDSGEEMLPEEGDVVESISGVDAEYSPDSDVISVQYRLNLGQVGHIYMSGMDRAVISYASGSASHVKFSGGYIQADTFGSVIDMAGSDKYGTFDISGGWFYRCDANAIIQGVGYNSNINITDGGFVGNTCSGSIISGGVNNLSLNGGVFGGNLTNSGVISLSNGWIINANSFDFGSNVCMGSGSNSAGVISAAIESFKSQSANLGDLIFGYNFANDYGGAMRVVSTHDSWDIANILFGNNVSRAYGGAVYIASNANNTKFSNCVFSGNQAKFGGAISLSNDNNKFYNGRGFEVLDCDFKNNYAKDSGGSVYASQNAGAISLKFSDVKILNSQIGSGRGAAFVFASGDGRLYLHNVEVLDSGDASHSAAVCFGDRASCTISGKVYFDDSSCLYPVGNGNTFLIDGSLDSASRIPVSVVSGVLSESNPFVVLASGLSSDELKALVGCFVVASEDLSVWFNSDYNYIVIGGIGDSVVGDGIKLEYYGYVNKVNLVRESTAASRIELLDFSSAGSMRANNQAVFSGNGGMLPNPMQLAANYPVRYVYFGEGVKPNTKRLERKLVSTELYRSGELHLSMSNAISVDSKNRFSDVDSEYDLSEIWVSKDSVEPGTDMSNVDNWVVVPYKSDLYFTLDEAVSASDENAILLRSENQTVRYVAQPVSSIRDVRAAFFDYDITDGKIYSSESLSSSGVISKADAVDAIGRYDSGQTSNGGTYWLKTNLSGINGGSGINFGFGNANINSGLSDVKLYGGYINQASSSYTFYQCAFGLVSGLDKNGDVNWSDGVHAPDIFDLTDGVGRTVFGNSSLRFLNDGNVFTLQSVVGPDGSPQTDAGQDLRDFGMFLAWSTKAEKWQNLFWPMDAAWTSDAEGHDPVFGKTRSGNYVPWRFPSYSGGTTMPSSDSLNGIPNTDHNSYFGMSSSIEFVLSDDYVGPLEFYFFGDDDLFIFLDDVLVCDLGGVHPSVGAYVDLRDYLPVKSAEEIESSGIQEQAHRLDIRYLERGASGSTCWMQFQLPTPLRTVTNVPSTENTTGEVEIVKNISGITGSDFEFDININLELPFGITRKDSYPVQITNPDGSVSSGILNTAESSGGTISVMPGAKYLIQNLPVGTKVSLSELDMPDAHWKLDAENSILSGTVSVEKLHLNLNNIYQTGELRVVKRVVDGDNNVISCNDNFYFNIELTDLNGNALQNFNAWYGIYALGSDLGNSSPIASGHLHTGMNAGIAIPGNHVLIVKNLDQEVKYTITEHNGELANSGYGQVSADNISNVIKFGDVQEAVVTNALLTDMPKLPSAGGVGNYRYIISGAALLGLVFLNFNKKKYSVKRA